MFSLICAWINRRVNNREAGDLRRYRAHYDVIVMNVTHGAQYIPRIMHIFTLCCIFCGLLPVDFTYIFQCYFVCIRLKWCFDMITSTPKEQSGRIFTVPERKFITKIPVRYHDPRWRRQQPVRMFTPRFLIFRIVFHVFAAGYRAIVSYCFYVIPEPAIEFDKML